MKPKPKISDDLLKEVAFSFFQEMNSDDSWIKQYEKETGKSAYEVPEIDERKTQWK